MIDSLTPIRLGTRGSALARWQAEYIAGLIRAAHPGIAVELVILSSLGDRAPDAPLGSIAGKGAFTADIESALLYGTIDAAVHSLKDLPTEGSPALTLAAVPPRGSVHDVLITRSGVHLANLPSGTVIGTSSPRRAAQVRHARPDLHIAPIRGNVDTRIAKAHDPTGAYDGVILAAAGVERLGRDASISQRLDLALMLPAPGQGAIAVQTRADAAALNALLAPISDPATAAATALERAFLSGLGAGCALPVAAHAVFVDGALDCIGRVIAPDGSRMIEVQARRIAPDAIRQAGADLAQAARDQGAADLMRAFPNPLSDAD